MQQKVNLAEKFELLKRAYHPDATEETLVLLIEPDGTPNTGDAGGAMTAEPREL